MKKKYLEFQRSEKGNRTLFSLPYKTENIYRVQNHHSMFKVLQFYKYEVCPESKNRLGVKKNLYWQMLLHILRYFFCAVAKFIKAFFISWHQLLYSFVEEIRLRANHFSPSSTTSFISWPLYKLCLLKNIFRLKNKW